MVEELIKTKTSYQATLDKIAKRIYRKIGEFIVEYCPSQEPIDKDQANKLEYKHISKGKAWGRNAFCCAWFKFQGVKPEGKNIVAMIDICGEGLVYDSNGEVITSITAVSNRINSFQPFRGKQIVQLDNQPSDFTLYIDAGFNGIGQSNGFVPKLNKCDICIKDDDYHELYYSFTAIMAAMFSIDDKMLIQKFKKALAKAKKLIKSPTSALEVLKTCYGDVKLDDVEFYAIGHGHLDLAWLWPIRESQRKAVRTISAQLVNIDKYPDFKFGISQPQQLEWIKNSHPHIFEQIKQQISLGNIEPQGGMWVECDCNLVSGESLIRQFYYGLNFWKNEIGVDVKTCWLPDVFGFTGALPQIIKGCGIDNFFTIKMSWNKINKFPYNSFNWHGIDDTNVLAHISPLPNYTCTGSPFVFNKARKNYTEKTLAPVALIAYGVGDGGCGCNEGNVEMVSKSSQILGMPKVQFGSADEFFDRLSDYKDRLPRYDGELYLEMHQGTFTTQAKNKWYNRKIEFLLHDVEFLQAQLMLKGLNYKAYSIDEIWKEVLLYQFHDILPGSSINRVYKESVERYSIIYATLKNIIEKMIKQLGHGVGYFNLSAANVDKIIDVSGEAKRLTAKPYSNAELLDINQFKMQAKDNILDNGIIKLTFNHNGEIVSLYSYAIRKEFSSKMLNSLVVYSDPIINYNAWDISSKYEKLPKTVLSCKKVKVSQYSDRIERDVIYKYNKSVINQKIILRMGSECVDFETKVDWHESNKMLRADFYPSCFGGTVTCDTQFGFKTYSTHENTSYEKAKFEINAHKFIDTCNDDCGIAIINDCKYGFRAKRGKISMNLLRSTFSPDPKADRGVHEFKYRIFAHDGDMLDSNVQNLAYEFNNEVLPVSLNSMDVISVDNDKIVIETIKPSYDGSGIIVRLYEKSGSSQSVNLKTLPCALYSTDLLENNKKPCGKNLQFHKFEIKTILLEFE